MLCVLIVYSIIGDTMKNQINIPNSIKEKKDNLKEQIIDRLFDHPQHNYFLDYVTINFRIDRKIHNTNQLLMTKEILSRFYNYINNRPNYDKKNIIEGWLQKKRKEFDYYWGIHFPQSSFNKMYHFITVQFSGRFWAGDVNHKYEPVNIYKKMDEKNRVLTKYEGTKIVTPRTQKIINDIELVYIVANEIREIIQSINDTYSDLKGKPILNTVSRIDIATQKRSSLNKGGHTNAPTLHQKRHPNNDVDASINSFTNQFSAFTLGKRNKQKNGIDRNKLMLRVYDKEQTVEQLNKLICQKRFGSTNWIRKEWELKPNFYGANSSHKITSIEDLRNCIKDKNRLQKLIKAMRKAADCLLYNDSKHYKSLHDRTTRKLLKESKFLTGKQLDQIYTNVKIPSADLVSDINKVSQKFIELNKKPWNPFAMIKGCINKHGKNISSDQFQELRDIIASF